MDYKKELEEIKQRVYNIATGTADVNYCNAKEIAEYIDPTLKRSEDEVMYDKLMHALDALTSYFDDDAIIIENEKPILKGEIGKIKEWLAKKNLTHPAFKPRFKVGDWITNGLYVYIIKDIDTYNNVYVAENKYGEENLLVFSYYDKNFHLWTISDARDGDILANGYFKPRFGDYTPWVGIYKDTLDELSFRSYCFVTEGHRRNNYRCGFVISSEVPKISHSVIGTRPATNEERKLLFQKMKENGYVWNVRTMTLERENGNDGDE